MCGSRNNVAMRFWVVVVVFKCWPFHLLGLSPGCPNGSVDCSSSEHTGLGSLVLGKDKITFSQRLGND